MKSWWGHCGRQPAKQAERIHVDGNGPIGVRALEGDADQAIGLRLDALFGDRRAKHVAQERLASVSSNPPARVAACRVKPSSEAYNGLS
jgi:hypothetical protein